MGGEGDGGGADPPKPMDHAGAGADVGVHDYGGRHPRIHVVAWIHHLK